MKALVIEVALFNLSTRFHLLDQEGAYQSISGCKILDKAIPILIKMGCLIA